MNMSIRVILGLGLIVSAGWGSSLAADKPMEVRAKFLIGRDTTFADGPVRDDGGIDFVAAINERLRGKITPEQNANVLLVQALGPTIQGDVTHPEEYFKWLGIAPLPKEGKYAVSFIKFMNPRGGLDAEGTLYARVMLAFQSPWKAEDQPLVKEWLDAMEKPLELAVAASRRTEYFEPLLSPDKKDRAKGVELVDCPSSRQTRVLCMALQARAMLKLGENRADDCWEDLQVIHRLARLAARGGSAAELLNAITMERMALRGDLEYLQAAKLAGELIRKKRLELQQLPTLAKFADKCDFFERILWLDILQQARFGNWQAVKNGSRNSDQEIELLKTAVLTDDEWNAGLRVANRWHDRAAVVFRIPDRELRNKEFQKLTEEVRLRKQLPERLRSDMLGDLAVTAHLPRIEFVQQFEDQLTQTRINVDLAYGLAAYRSEKGTSPEEWEAAVPKFIGAVPVDVFGGRRLKYLTQPEGFLFYSVGMNGKDEEGRGREDRPVGDDLKVEMVWGRETR